MDWMSQRTFSYNIKTLHRCNKVNSFLIWSRSFVVLCIVFTGSPCGIDEIFGFKIGSTSRNRKIEMFCNRNIGILCLKTIDRLFHLNLCFNFITVGRPFRDNPRYIVTRWILCWALCSLDTRYDRTIYACIRARRYKCASASHYLSLIINV